MKFPQYRKLSNEKSFYRIDDDRTFFEIQVIGKTSFLLKIEANQYPEILRIQDMLNEMEPFEKSSIDEFHMRYVKVVGK
jgi:hypothetical protein